MLPLIARPGGARQPVRLRTGRSHASPTLNLVRLIRFKLGRIKPRLILVGVVRGLRGRCTGAPRSSNRRESNHWREGKPKRALMEKPPLTPGATDLSQSDCRARSSSRRAFLQRRRKAARRSRAGPSPSSGRGDRSRVAQRCIQRGSMGRPSGCSYR